MARAIDNEAAYRFLSEQLVKETGAFSKGVNKGLNIARSAMRNPDAIPTLTPPNEWVSVDERLPGVSGNYICAVKDKNGSVWTIPAEWSLEMKMWIGAFGEIKNIVTHWMPLPVAPDRRPPEGEEDT